MWKELRISHYLGEGGDTPRIPIIHKPRQLRKLARSKDAGIRLAVARSNYTPVEVLQILLADESWPVRMAVAWHKKTTLPMLRFLARDPEITVREAVKRHPFFNEKVYEEPALPGLYFRHQEPCPCGCYYPDVTRMYDTPHGRMMFCIRHGVYEALGRHGPMSMDIELIPTDEWREKERSWIDYRARKLPG